MLALHVADTPALPPDPHRISNVNRSQALTTTIAASLLAAITLLVTPDVAAALTLPSVSVPEPATTALVATGIAGMALEIRRRRRK